MTLDIQVRPSEPEFAVLDFVLLALSLYVLDYTDIPLALNHPHRSQK